MIENNKMTNIELALGYAKEYGQIDGSHHNAWVIDQMVRALTNCPMETRVTKDYRGNEYEYITQGESDDYLSFVKDFSFGEDRDETYFWDVGIAP